MSNKRIGNLALVGGSMGRHDKANSLASSKCVGYSRLTTVLLLTLSVSLSASEGNRWSNLAIGQPSSRQQPHGRNDLAHSDFGYRAIAPNGSQEQNRRRTGSNAHGAQTNQAAGDVLSQVVAAYHSASSYQDKGTAIIHLASTDASYRIEFETLFKRPNKLRFAWTQLYNRVPGSKQRAVIWYDGVTAWARYSIHGNELERKRDLELLVAGATGASWGTAHTISGLLTDEIAGTRLAELRSLRIIGSEAVGGVECTVLLGKIPSGGESKIWVARRDNLIRRIEERFGNVKLEEVLTEISVNEDIPDSRFSESGN